MSDFGADIFDHEPPSPPPPPASAGGKRPARRKPRKSPEPSAAAEPDTASAVEGDAQASPPVRRRRRTAEAADPGDAPATAAPRTRRRRVKADAEDAAAPAAEPAVEAPAPTRALKRPEAEPRGREAREQPPRDEPLPATEPHLSRWTQRHHQGPGDHGAEKHVRVAVLLDLHHLQEAARGRGGELSFRKLLRNLTGERRVLRAVCYLLEDAPKPAAGAIAASGFEVHVLDNAAAIGERMRTDAAALPSGVETVVLAPGTGDQLELARRLAEEGLRIETANFEPTGAMGFPHRQLGRECVFVP